MSITPERQAAVNFTERTGRSSSGWWSRPTPPSRTSSAWSRAARSRCCGAAPNQVDDREPAEEGLQLRAQALRHHAARDRGRLQRPGGLRRGCSNTALKTRRTRASRSRASAATASRTPTTATRCEKRILRFPGQAERGWKSSRLRQVPGAGQEVGAAVTANPGISGGEGGRAVVAFPRAFFGRGGNRRLITHIGVLVHRTAAWKPSSEGLPYIIGGSESRSRSWPGRWPWGSRSACCWRSARCTAAGCDASWASMSVLPRHPAARPALPDLLRPARRARDRPVALHDRRSWSSG